MPEGIAEGGQAVAPGPAAGYAQPGGGPAEGQAAAFTPPERVRFSALAAEFTDTWAPRPEPGKDLEGEHVEVTGQSGSGKSFFITVIFHLRAILRDGAVVYVVTKSGDATVKRLEALGWPVVTTFDEVRKHRQCIFWPKTSKIGQDREKWFEEKIYDLLARLWRPKANITIGFDEIGFVQDLEGPKMGLRRRLKKLIQQYWREGRALGISVLASKQRPIDVVRDQHSESRWKAVFPPADMGDMERFAELLGNPRLWQPVLESLDQEQHEFVIRNNVTKDAFITWIDFELEDMPPLEQKGKTAREYLFGEPAGQAT